MTSRSKVLIFAIILVALILAACLGESELPLLESTPFPTRAAPPVNPTISAAPRLSLSLVGELAESSQSAPQVGHDLIGRDDCLMCHKQGVSGAPRMPDTHRGLESNTCLTCHTAPASADLSGSEMYTRVCARCHGDNGEGVYGPALNSKTFLRSVTDEEIRTAILRGRGVSEMLSWGDLGLLTERQVDELVAMIRSWEPTAPEVAGSTADDSAKSSKGDPDQGREIFSRFCSGCHGLEGESEVGEGFILQEAVEELDDTAITSGIRDGGQGMPSFHALLTADEINDLLAMMRTWHMGPAPTPTPIAFSGEEVFLRVCARCHGEDGEGGVGPALNSKEFLAGNDDNSIRQWIERGTLGTNMLSWGDLGLLKQEQIEELVAFIRSWEPTAPETTRGTLETQPPRALSGDSASGQHLFAQFCSGCHGLDGKHQTGDITLNSAAFLDSVNDEILASQIQNGGREMPSFHAILTSQEVNDLLAFMRKGFIVEEEAVAPSFSKDIQPIFSEKCVICHGTAGGWNADSYESVMSSGDNSPVVVAGDPSASLLAQKILGTQSQGAVMPPGGLLPEDIRQLILDWIKAGAPDN